MLHRLFLLLFECGLSHDASHVVWAVVKYPSPSPQLHHRGQTASLQRVPRDQRCLQLAKISLPVFLCCWDFVELSFILTKHFDECCSEPLHIIVFRGSFERFSATMSSNTQQSKSCPIPTRVLHLKDWSQLPDCYSQTPGGTLFSTTPGGKTVLYAYTVSVGWYTEPVFRGI